SLSNNSPSDSAINTRSSAYNNSHGSPHLNCIDSASNTIINNKELSTEPWCTPTFTSKSSLMLSLTLTAVFTSSYNDCITLTSHSSTFRFLRDHQRISLRTLSNAFSKSTKAIHSSFFLHRYLSCSCLTMNMASVCGSVTLAETKLHTIQTYPRSHFSF